MSKTTDSTLALVLLLASAPQHVRSEPRTLRSSQLSNERLSPGKQLTGQPGRDTFSQSLAGKVTAYKAAPYAELSHAIYEETPPERVGYWKQEEVTDKKSGLRVATYRDSDGKVAVVFKGSDSLEDLLKAYAKHLVKPGIPMTTHEIEAARDWLQTNIPQHLLGVETQQYKEAKEHVQQLINKGVSPQDIIVTGHSLGGGLAQYAASMATLPDGKNPARVDAYTFNAAGLGLANQTRAVLSDGWSNIVNIYAGDDPLRLANALTPATGNLGQVIVYGGGRGDQPGGHDIVAFSRDLSRIARQFEQSPEFPNFRKTEERRRMADFNRFLREEARREHHEDQRIEYRADRLRDLDRQAEYQFAKSAIDAHGNRVRIETYLRRPLPTQVEHWVLNYRAQRFDYGYFRRTYAQALASLSDIPRLDALTGGSPTLPSNYLVQSEEVRSNTRDTMRFTTDFGAPAAVNDPVRGTIYVPVTIDLRTRLVGPGYDALKSHFTTTNNPNDFRNISRYPDAGGNLAVWLDSTINRASSLCAPCTTNPAAAPDFQFSSNSPNFVTIRHKDNTFLSYENWVLRDDGTPVPNGAVGNDINYEFRNRATEFQGRDIDIVYPSRFLVEGAPGAF